MSIYYYVTRKSDPLLDETGPQISEDEWRSVVTADPELALEQPSDGPGVPRNAVFAVWRSYPGGYPAWFALLKGNVEVKGLDESLLSKLRYFASALDARIFCEDGTEIT